MIQLTNKRFTILGLQGAGKSEFAKHLLRGVKNHLVYDPLQEYDGFNRYIPDDRNSVEELDMVIQKLVIPKLKPDLFIIDELNRYAPPKPRPLSAGLAELNDWSRHMGIAWGGAARRPSQIHSDLMELAHYLFIFVLKGKNDGMYLDSLLPHLSDVVSELPEWHFAVVTESRSVSVHSPIPV